ncbi:hypothetical protein BJ741DRAFT_637649 [Chytriomyces cf. hyalinus JEL632]|nr:hypothetical protein BJ741DRAFT_637649 [Chytriomyces cf. hyalinus JEL632]
MASLPTLLQIDGVSWDLLGLIQYLLEMACLLQTSLARGAHAECDLHLIPLLCSLFHCLRNDSDLVPHGVWQHLLDMKGQYPKTGGDHSLNDVV